MNSPINISDPLNRRLLQLLNSVYVDTLTAKKYLPILAYNNEYLAPYHYESDPLQNDKKYQKRVINNIYDRLIEKWLYHDPIFLNLIKYFKIEKKGDTNYVSIIDNINQKSEKNFNKSERLYILKYIEKYFINKKIIKKIIKNYVKSSRSKWYDLFNKTDILKETIDKKLKTLIISTIYELGDNKKEVS